MTDEHLIIGARPDVTVPLSIPAHCFALIVYSHYGEETVHVEHKAKSTQPDKMKAEVMRLYAGVRKWAQSQGITITDDGTVTYEENRA